MPDCFISYSTQDDQLAQFVCEELKKHGLSVFLASVSLQPGDKWRDRILNAVRESTWLIFLASHDAARSAFVQQELGMALAGEKKVVPVVWDMPPEMLPGWVDQSQALDLRGADAAAVRERITVLAKMMRTDKEKGLLIAGALVLGLILLGRS